jgi:hypothetical protein
MINGDRGLKLKSNKAMVDILRESENRRLFESLFPKQFGQNDCICSEVLESNRYTLKSQNERREESIHIRRRISLEG